jgi:hypothetical protein
VLFDDTVCFLSLDTRQQAEGVLEIPNSEPAQAFLQSMIFWDDKRPITIELLRRLHINRLAALIGRDRGIVCAKAPHEQLESTN